MPGPLVLAAGISGLTAADADPAGMLGQLGARFVGVHLAHDSTTSYLGALGTAPGAVVAAGTGVVTLGVGPAGVARVDGWGYLMGDAGSGFWIGRRALEAVMRAHDGRGPATALTDVVRAQWPELPEAYMALQADPERVSRVASFAYAVAEAATSGDTVAREITELAAAELAHSVRIALARAGVTEAPVCAALGGVFRSEALRKTFTTQLWADTPRPVRVIEPAGTSVDGAATLATLPADHPLATQVWSATREGMREGAAPR
ncbi:hypothetical protein GCM10009808_01620 [Microbacterium sediminicola]|uniref:ATPase BadF/BadG/BcrA/BcrD type domain-containing protein n=1 Tax=Microbacterium sediminicola TaxID=415210 RepID=A0ABN2HI46_9MICO